MNRRREFICDLLLGLGGNLIVLGIVLLLLFFANVLPIRTVYGGLFSLLFIAISVLGAVAVCAGLVLDRVTAAPSQAIPEPSPQVKRQAEEAEGPIAAAQPLPKLNLGQPQA